MGYCVVEAIGDRMRLLTMDVLKLHQKLDNYQRLQLIHQTVFTLIKSFQPNSFAIEAPFFGKNVQSMLKLGRAQGVSIAAAMTAGLEVCEYSPRKIKQSITGNGNADKLQVWKMLQQILSLQETELKCFDASDALAVAVCHHFQGARPQSPKKSDSWSKFVMLHPNRVK